MDNQQKLEREWKLIEWEEKRKDREQIYQHRMGVFRFMLILIPLTATLIAFIFKSEDTTLTTVAAILASWLSTTVFERHRHGIQLLLRKRGVNGQRKKIGLN